MSIEQDFDISFVAGMALREKQIQQNYRPIIAVHKWFARRPGTLFRALLLAEFGTKSLQQSFFSGNSLTGIRVADPFMGGGTPLIEANRMGCDVVGFDINPMAYWIVRQEIDHLDVAAYQQAAAELVLVIERKLGKLYRTRCTKCNSEDASVKYFLWVKTLPCQECSQVVDLFPGYLLAGAGRHPRNVVICAGCGELTEVVNLDKTGRCSSCRKALLLDGPARRNRCACSQCKFVNRYPNPKAGPPLHRLFGLEYHCYRCKPDHKGRFFKKPDDDDLGRYAEAQQTWAREKSTYVPDDEIPKGDETNRLHRWGYRHYREMFNDRQLLGLETSAREVAGQTDERVRNALATNLSDLLRYQNMLCRYDAYAMKSLDVFSVHGFPVGLIQCESNLLGIPSASAGTSVGSGGWSNIIDKYTKAKAYCDKPFEIRHWEKRKVVVHIPGEWIGDRLESAPGSRKRVVDLRCKSATDADLPESSLDAVFTDPPYFGNVQYAELMDFCYVWLRRLIGETDDVFRARSTRSENELTGNATLERGLSHFAEGLSQVFCRMAKALRPGSPLAFTFHHNTLEAYQPIAVAILDAEMACTASIPCPAEMVASIHINGTGSSVIDTVFVCRSRDLVAHRRLNAKPDKVAELVLNDLDKLREGGVNPTRGDSRCVAFGHLTRLAISSLQDGWSVSAPIEKRLATVAEWLSDWGEIDIIEERVLEVLDFALGRAGKAQVNEGVEEGALDADVSL